MEPARDLGVYRRRKPTYILTMHFIIPTLAFGSLGGGDYLVILFLCLLFFGSKKLPELAKGMGQAMREFKKTARKPSPPTRPHPSRHRPPLRPRSRKCIRRKSSSFKPARG